MNNEKKSKPFFSLLILLGSLFLVVFCKMEIRRMGYMILKDSKLEKELKENVRLKRIEYASLMSSERIERMAQKVLTLKKPKKEQVIVISLGGDYESF